jgi:hypothetical protein
MRENLSRRVGIDEGSRETEPESNCALVLLYNQEGIHSFLLEQFSFDNYIIIL